VTLTLHVAACYGTDCYQRFRSGDQIEAYYPLDREWHPATCHGKSDKKGFDYTIIYDNTPTCLRNHRIPKKKEDLRRPGSQNLKFQVREQVECKITDKGKLLGWAPVEVIDRKNGTYQVCFLKAQALVGQRDIRLADELGITASSRPIDATQAELREPHTLKQHLSETKSLREQIKQLKLDKQNLRTRSNLISERRSEREAELRKAKKSLATTSSQLKSLSFHTSRCCLTTALANSAPLRHSLPDLRPSEKGIPESAGTLTNTFAQPILRGHQQNAANLPGITL